MGESFRRNPNDFLYLEEPILKTVEIILKLTPKVVDTIFSLALVVK